MQQETEQKLPPGPCFRNQRGACVEYATRHAAAQQLPVGLYCWQATAVCLTVSGAASCVLGCPDCGCSQRGTGRPSRPASSRLTAGSGPCGPSQQQQCCSAPAPDPQEQRQPVQHQREAAEVPLMVLGCQRQAPGAAQESTSCQRCMHPASPAAAAWLRPPSPLAGGRPWPQQQHPPALLMMVLLSTAPDPDWRSSCPRLLRMCHPQRKWWTEPAASCACRAWAFAQ